jgi:Sec-independent protein translocase protein TatA
MDIFGIGPLEIAFILILVIIIFGLKDLMKTSKTIGKSLNKFVRSDTWKTINQTTQELKNLPNRLMREAGLDELEQITKEGLAKTDNTIRPPADAKPAADTPPVVIETPEKPPQTDPDRSPQPDPAIEPPDKDSPA